MHATDAPSDGFVTVASVMSIAELAMVEAELREQGIAFRLLDEHTVQVAPHLSNAIGGVRVQVLAEDLEQAQRLLLDLGLQPERPHEGSGLFEDITEGTEHLPWVGNLPPAQRFLIISAFIVILCVLIWALNA